MPHAYTRDIHPLQAEALACIAPLVCFAGQAKPCTLPFTIDMEIDPEVGVLGGHRWHFSFPTNNPRAAAFILGRSEYVLPVSLSCVFRNHVALHFLLCIYLFLFLGCSVLNSFVPYMCSPFMDSPAPSIASGTQKLVYLFSLFLFSYSFIQFIHLLVFFFFANNSPACSDSLILVLPHHSHSPVPAPALHTYITYPVVHVFLCSNPATISAST
jgi:hypothetical protein